MRVWVKQVSSAVALPNGIQALRWARWSCKSGVSCPGNNANCLSRGKMTLLATRAIAVAACGGKLLAAVGFEVARLLTAADERTAAVGTGGALGSAGGGPGGGAAL